MRTTVRAAALVAAMAALTLTGCKYTPPCNTLAPPTANEIGAARDGAEVEREVGKAECVVIGNTWQPQND